MDLIEQLSVLIKMQTVDKTLYVLEVEAADIPVRLGGLSLDEDRLKQSLAVAQAELDQVTARRKSLEADNEAIRARLRKAESRLMGAKTQREYRAATAEMEEGKDAVKANDDQLIELMERQEALDKQVAGIAGELAKVSAEVEAQRQALTARAQEVSAQIQLLNQERSTMTGKVERELLDEYDFIRKARLGMAMAGVQDGTCGACRIDIPPQQFNLLQRMDKLMFCPSCRRIMFWADHELLKDLV